MSTPFYDLASLVLVPSGYKAQKVYAQKPLTTDGQLTFSRASTATRVNSAGLIETVSSNVPRLDYLGSTCPKLLLEPQRTNLVRYSEQFDNAVWGEAGVAITANQAVSPDGNTNADLAVNTSSVNYLYQGLGNPFSGTYTVSIFAKKGSQSSFAFGMVAGGFTGGMGVKFNFDSQTFSTPTNYGNFTSISASYQSYGNGWYRLSLTGTTATSTTYFFVLGSLQESFAVNAYIYGAQAEAGAYPTSLINTTTAAVTRLADACSKTGISSLIGQTEGTLFIETTYNGVANTGQFNRLINITDGTTTNFISLAKNNTTAELYVYSETSAGVQVNSTPIANTNIIGTHKIALSYKANDFVLYVDGVQRFTDTSAAVAVCNTLNIGTLVGGDELGGSVNQALLFKTRLTNAQLAELTTL